MNKKEAFSLERPENIISKKPPDGSDESWIGYENVTNDLNWLFDGFEKIYSLLSDTYKKTPEFIR